MANYSRYAWYVIRFQRFGRCIGYRRGTTVPPRNRSFDCSSEFQDCFHPLCALWLRYRVSNTMIYIQEDNKICRLQKSVKGTTFTCRGKIKQLSMETIVAKWFDQKNLYLINIQDRNFNILIQITRHLRTGFPDSTSPRVPEKEKMRVEEGRQICESIENSGDRGCGTLETTKAEITLSSSKRGVDEGLPVFN